MFAHNQRTMVDGRPEEVWKFTVNTEATSAGEKTTGIPLNLVDQTGVQFIVDWGDDSKSVLTSELYTANNSTASVHEYAEAGEYQITITGKRSCWEKTYLFKVDNSLDQIVTLNNGIAALYWWRRTLVSVDSAIPKILGMKYCRFPNSISSLDTRNNDLTYFFIHCTYLQSIPADLFINNTEITNFTRCFRNCSSLQSIPEGLFDNCTAATSFWECFEYCSSIASIPEGLFDKNTTVTSFMSCFEYCSSLQSIPEGLFDKNTAVTSFSSCFWGCSSIASIPEGLFDNNTAVTSFYGCFFDCSSIASIPSGLFDKNTAVTNFGQCFYGCSSLTSIPSGLFDKNTAVTSFSNCFNSCSSIRNIPSGLFDNNTAVTDFTSTFQYTSLQSIPEGLFNKCTAATTFYYCFSYCGIKSIPVDLFAYNTAATNLDGCFYSCNNLQNFKLIIGSELASKFTSFVNGVASNVTRIVCVPDNSTTYTKLSSYAEIGNYKNNITVSTINLDCVQTMEYTVDTDATTTDAKDATIPLSVVQNALSKLLIDWGDGNGVELTPENVTTANLTHTYSTAGNYQITVGTINWLDYQLLADSNASSSNTLIQTFRETVVSIDESIPLLANNASLDYWFYNCKKLISYTGHIFDNLPNATSAVSTFNGCTSLSTISAGTLRKQEALTNAASMFEECTTVTYIPSGLISQCRQLTNATQMFKNCTSLTYYPNTLLLNNTALTTRTNMFAGCSNTNPTFYTKTQLESNGYYVELFDTEASGESNGYIGIPWTLYNQTGTLTVDWGDTSSSILTSTNYSTETNFTASIHQYSNKGLYFVSSLGDDWNNIPGVYVLNCVYNTTNLNILPITISYDSVQAFLKFRRHTLIEVATKIPQNCITRCYYMYTDSNRPSSYTYSNDTSPDIPARLQSFYEGCIRLKFIPGDVFTNNNARHFESAFYCCCSLKNIPSGLFDTQTNVYKFGDENRACFKNCISLTSIPAGLFDNCTIATHFTNCFYNCSSLESIPSGLFDNNTAAITFYQCFNSCSSLESIPTGLFDNNTAVTSFYGCFSGCSSLQSIPSGLFDNNTAVISFQNCFYGCSSIQSIPSGLFDNCTVVTAFNSCFSGCSSLKSIPSGLFDNNTVVTDFYSCFHACSSLQSIPQGLFDNNVAVTSFQSCFSSCSSLKSIPSGLFDNNTVVTDFYSCFSSCSSIQSIPSGLFDNCTAVTNFSYCFSNCTSLQSIPSGLFDNCIAVTNFSYCFYQCTSLLSISAGLFDHNTAVTSFSNCFYNCTSLQSIPSGLFDKNTAATSFLYCFYSCTSLTDFTLHIGSSSVSNCSSFVSKKAGTTRTVYVPADSTTYTTFNTQADTLGLTVISKPLYDITLESSDEEKPYDGTPLTGGTVTLSSGSMDNDDSFTYQMTGSQTLIGSSENTFTYSINNASNSFYNVTQWYGSLAVTDDDLDQTPEFVLNISAEGEEGSENEIQYELGDNVAFEIEIYNPYDEEKAITLTASEGLSITGSVPSTILTGSTATVAASHVLTAADVANGSYIASISVLLGEISVSAECTVLTQ